MPCRAEKVGDFLNALRTGEKTCLELSDVSTAKVDTIKRWMIAFQEIGWILPGSGRRSASGLGMPAKTFRLNPAIFNLSPGCFVITPEMRAAGRKAWLVWDGTNDTVVNNLVISIYSEMEKAKNQ